MATSPLDLIRIGIVKGDWELVAKGYEGMSGVSVSPPTKQDNGLSGDERKQLNQLLVQMDQVLHGNKAAQTKASPEPEEEAPAIPWDDQDDELADAVVGMIDDEEVEEEVEEEEVFYDEEEEVALDNDEEVDLDDEDVGLAAVLNKIVPPKRAPANRQPAQRVEVACEKCSKHFSIPPALVPAVEEEGDTIPYVCTRCKSGYRPTGAVVQSSKRLFTKKSKK